MEFTTGLSVKPEKLVGIEEVSKADREDETHECISNLHHGGCVDLDQNEILHSQKKRYTVVQIMFLKEQFCTFSIIVPLMVQETPLTVLFGTF